MGFFGSSGGDKSSMPTREQALPGRSDPIVVAEKHVVLGSRTREPFPEGMKVAMFGLGCFWGAEKKFWQTPGVYSTQSATPRGTRRTRPTVRSAPAGPVTTRSCVSCSTRRRRATRTLLKTFWESHDPTQGMRQGNDAGTQYRSGIYVYDAEQRAAAEASRDAFQKILTKEGHARITTEILDAPPFYYAEDYHQQYLAKNPDGYCGLGGLGVACPVGLATA